MKFLLDPGLSSAVLWLIYPFSFAAALGGLGLLFCDAMLFKIDDVEGVVIGSRSMSVWGVDIVALSKFWVGSGAVLQLVAVRLVCEFVGACAGRSGPVDNMGLWGIYLFISLLILFSLIEIFADYKQHGIN
jgi:hypothetical protein